MVLDARLTKLRGVPARRAAHAFILSMTPTEPMGAEERSEADEFAATVEAMFLMAAVDGTVSQAELAQLHSSIAAIAAPEPVGAGLESLLATCTERLSAEGWQARVDAVSRRLSSFDARTLAFRLAVGVAMVDDDVAHAEAAAIDVLAGALGISPDDSQAILREVVDDLFGPG